MSHLFATRLARATRPISSCLALAAVLLLAVSVPPARGVHDLGNVDPSDPSAWTSSTEAYVGLLHSGTLTADGGSDLLSYDVYIGYMEGVTGADNLRQRLHLDQ